MADTSKENSLGLEFNNLSIKDESAHPPESGSTSPATETAAVQEGQSPSTDEPVSPNAPKDAKESKEKKRPYVNPDRFKTGGNQRDKLSEEELVERMERMRQQNEKIKQRRLDVQADEDAFHKSQQEEKSRQLYNRKVQDNVDRTREQNAKRKMEKVQSREWDSGKPSPDWKGKKVEGADNEEPQQRDSGGWSRGGRGGRGRGAVGRGAGRKREPGTETAKLTEITTETTTPTPQAAGTETKE
ncbi:hypothetical protein E1B28_008542 [Marasmius oreades]|uniref:Uncharacterized protein n=1 Tax=Marasmius oreades TaxID=181124 RepID=A0A9P7S071_9AGAR|nr:uncharacterized protein E1B28_008542 [Marasmius oreades]KAG7092173.1 hypothetical protein E1B28_008542 [Marasmius oreades]